MENKTLTSDQLTKLKETVRQRFDELYHRIGTNRQSLATKVLLVDQSINKELTKEKIDASHEAEILRKIREIEKIANNQLPHIPKPISSPVSTPASAPKPAPAAKPTKPVKPEKTAKTPKAKKVTKPAKTSKPAKSSTSKSKKK